MGEKTTSRRAQENPYAKRGNKDNKLDKETDRKKEEKRRTQKSKVAKPVWRPQGGGRRARPHTTRIPGQVPHDEVKEVKHLSQ